MSNAQGTTAAPGNPRTPATLCRRFGPVVVTAIVLVVRLTALSALSVSPFYLPEDGDMRFYHDWAIRFLHGTGTDGTAFYGLPGYPVLLSLFYSVFGIDPFLATLPQVICDAVVGGLIFALTADLLEGWKGLGAAAAAGIGWAFFNAAQSFSIILMPTSYVVLALWLLVWWIKRATCATGGNAAWPWGAMGLLIGLIATGVATILFAIPLVLAGAAVRFGTVRGTALAATLALCGVAIGTSPCWIYNRFVAREPVYLTAHSGLNFFLGNHDGATGYPKAPPGMRLSQAGMLADSITMAETASGHPLTKAGVSLYWSEKARSFIAANPTQWLRLVGLKIANFWNAFEFDDLTVMRIHRAARVAPPGIPFGFVAALALPALLVFAKRRGTGRWVVAAVILHMLSLLTVFVTERYRLAAVPGLLILGSAGTAWLWDRCARGQWAATALYFATGCAGALWIGATPRDPGCWALGHFGIGIKQLAAGDLAASERRLILAHRYVNRNAEIHFALGNLALAQRRPGVALDYFERTLALDPAHTRALNNRAVLDLEAGRWNEAIEALERSRRIDGQNAKTFYLLARAHRGRGNRDAALEAIGTAIRLNPNLAEYAGFAKTLRDEPAPSTVQP